MGVTSKSISILKPLIEKYTPKSVCDLGAQNLYCDRPVHPNDDFIESKKWIERLGVANLYNNGAPGYKYPFASEMWQRCGIEYMAIDTQGHNDSVQWDLSEPLKTTREFDLVMDYGTSEHVKDHYQCFKNIHDLTKMGGIMIHENPKIGNWPGHCYHYLNQVFYEELAYKVGYTILHIEEWPAMGNITDGWNVICVMQKTADRFIKREFYPTTYIK